MYSDHCRHVYYYIYNISVDAGDEGCIDRNVAIITIKMKTIVWILSLSLSLFLSLSLSLSLSLHTHTHTHTYIYTYIYIFSAKKLYALPAVFPISDFLYRWFCKNRINGNPKISYLIRRVKTSQPNCNNLCLITKYWNIGIFLSTNFRPFFLNCCFQLNWQPHYCK